MRSARFRSATATRCPRGQLHRAVGHAGELRVAARHDTARPPGTDDRLRLVEPDRDVGAQPQDQLPCDPRLGLRRREEVAVEVDSARVPAAVAREAVRVQLVHDPEVDARPRAARGSASLRFPRTRSRGCSRRRGSVAHRPARAPPRSAGPATSVRAAAPARRAGRRRSGRATPPLDPRKRARAELGGHVRDRPDLPRPAEPREDELICVRPADDRPASVRRRGRGRRLEQAAAASPVDHGGGVGVDDADSAVARRIREPVAVARAATPERAPRCLRRQGDRPCRRRRRPAVARGRSTRSACRSCCRPSAGAARPAVQATSAPFRPARGRRARSRASRRRSGRTATTTPRGSRRAAASSRLRRRPRRPSRR